MVPRLNRLKALVRFLITVAFDAGFGLVPSRSRPGEKEDSRRELLLVRVDAIGDFILWLDSFRELREIYPPEEWRITLVGNEIWRDLADEMPHADRYWFVDVDKFRRNFIYRTSWLRRLRSARFDLAISPVYSRRALTSDSLCGLSGAAERIANEGGGANITGFERRLTNRWFTQLIPAAGTQKHELERNAAFLTQLCGTTVEPRVGTFPASARKGFPEIKGDYFLISASASDPRKCWPIENLAVTARQIYGATSWAPVLVGGAGDCEQSARLRLAAPDLPWIDLTGRTQLDQIVSVVKSSRLCVCNDTMLVHLCAAVETPVVAILGGGHFGEFLPYPEGLSHAVRPVFHQMRCFGCNWECDHRDYDGKHWPCISEIGVASVVKQIEKLSPHKEASEST